MDELNRILSEKVGMLKELADMSRAQAGFIDQQDAEGLDRITIERQACIDAVDALDARIRSAGASAGAERNAQTGSLREEIRALIAVIQGIDEENLRMVKALSESLMSGIRDTIAEKKLLAYQPAYPRDSVYVNKKG